MKPPHMRPFEEKDRQACLDIFDSNTPPYFDPSERKLFEDFLAAPPCPFFVLELAGEIAGCGGQAVSRETPGAVDLVWGMIHRRHHRRGLGKLLTAERIRLAFESPDINAVVMNTSQHVLGFYESFGFKLQKKIPDGYGPGLHRHELILPRHDGKSS